MNEQASKYWLDTLVDDIISRHPDGEIVVSSGHSPSGVYHVGTLREILTADLITWAIRQRGRQVRHIDVVDNFDAFRKIPAGVDESFVQYIGRPLVNVPDPFGDCHDSYGAHYLAQLYEALAHLGVQPEVVLSYDKYQAGAFAPSVETALNKLGEVRQIITEVGRRELDEGWAPVQILGDNGSLREWKFAGWNSDTKTVSYTTKDGKGGNISLADEPGRLKLDWRLDWPARWALYGVQVEPFGRDHAAKGGSYQTGEVLVREIFGVEAPYPVPYEFINPVGETKKMSKSDGKGITPNDLLEVMPAEVLRYFVARPRPGRTLQFDSGVGLFNLLDEYSKLKADYYMEDEIPDRHAFEYAAGSMAESLKSEVISGVPFNHLVSVYQAAQGDIDHLNDILERTGYTVSRRTLEHEAQFVANWLEKFAPDSVKFSVQKDLPEVELSKKQQEMLAALADKIDGAGEMDGEIMHNLIYEARAETGLKPAEAFQAIYRIILGQDSGPKAGWFLASLDRDWLVNRLRRQA